jgi:hypothetical protein
MVEPPKPADENLLALYGLFCGVVAVPTAFLFGIGAFFGVMAIVLGRAALRPRAPVRERRGLAIAGIVLGIVGILLAVGIWLG